MKSFLDGYDQDFAALFTLPSPSASKGLQELITDQAVSHLVSPSPVSSLAFSPCFIELVRASLMT